MDLRRLSFAPVLGAAVLTGCVTSSSPPAPETARATSHEAPVPPVPGDQMGKLQAFITNQGLTSTPAKPGEAARLTAAWNNKILYAPDPTHGGDPVPGLLARIWIFGPDTKDPLTVDGELIVGVWDNAPKATGGQPVLHEVWHIDAEAAKKFRRTDFMGEGYTLFLPWSRYSVDLKQVNVVARFNGADGRNLVSSPERLTLDHSATLERAQDKLNGLSAGPPTQRDVSGPAILPPPVTAPPTK
jgi:hypothetical protein